MQVDTEIEDIINQITQGPQGPQPAPQPEAREQYGTTMDSYARKVSDEQVKADLELVQEVFFSHFPAFRPNYSDCQVLMACVYQMSLHGQLSMGQRTLCNQILKRLRVKGVIK